ncbi:MAG: rRNA (guanine966-N2)-methyltransferase [Frankiaceae bacterium]|nr:rRNA (guanine966-N2)-methyltransferase [Frankiaceae bacterium]
MTRIIAGAARGRRIAVPEGKGTRPTSDRAREALFSALEAALRGGLGGRRFLDLYAGSGAVGLEALSRGAGVATLVESDAKAVRVLKANAKTLGMSPDIVALAVERMASAPALTPYDVVFADPPYSMEAPQLSGVLANLLLNGWIADDAVVVVERPSRERGWSWPEGFEERRTREYGAAVLRYARRS